MTEQDKKANEEIEELKQAILECRGLYKGCKINKTTAHALAGHLHHVANYRKGYLVEQEAINNIFSNGKFKLVKPTEEQIEAILKNCNACAERSKIKYELIRADIVEDVRKETAKEILQILYDEAMRYGKTTDGIVYMANKYGVKVDE